MQGIDDTPSTDSMLNNTGSPDNTTVIVAIVTVLVLVAIIVVVVIAFLVVVIMCRKRRHESDRVHKLQSMVLETKEAESHMDYQYEIIDKNGVKAAASGATTVGALCSNPDKAITDDGYSHLRDSQKKKVPLRKWQQ